MEKRHDEEEQSHGRMRIEKEVDRQSVTEECKQGHMAGEIYVIISRREIGEQAAFRYISTLSTQYRPISYRCEQIFLASPIPPQNDQNFASGPTCCA